MAKKVNWLIAEEKIRKTGLVIFSPLDLKRILGVSDISVRFFLTRYVRKGAIIKLRNNLYALSNNPPSELEIANALYQPSYISLTYALSYYNLIPEAVYSITSVTTRATAVFNIHGKEFRYHKIKISAFTGYLPEKINGKTILIADKEKALVDYLYFAGRKLYKINDRLDTSHLKKTKIIMYARLFNNATLERLIKEML